MYVPPLHRVTDRTEVVAFMRAHPFATLVTAAQGTPVATHLPCAVDAVGERVVIVAHMARANPQRRGFDAALEALVIFGGPHAYVSPRHCATEVSVPTWNYVAVHAYGRPRLAESREAKLATLARLVADAEPDYLERFARLPGDYLEKMLAGIAAFTIEVERIEARFKLSQEKQPEERGRIVAELEVHDDGAARETAALMRAHGPVGAASGITIDAARIPDDVAAARSLFVEYQRAIGVDLCFQGFAEELATLPGKYAPPDGRLFLARRGGEPVGCIALRRHDARSGEVKRLYVQPRARGLGIGLALAEAVLAAAREVGFARLVLDTLAEMKAARALYASLGFREIPAYYDNPLPGAICMGLDLAPAGLPHTA